MWILAAALTCTLVAVDGDTLRCGSERIRLLGIDAPEMPGHCRRGRQCVPGDPWRSKAELQNSLGGRASIERVGTDRYGRTLARVEIDGVDLSCHQLATRNARYIGKWDDGGRVARRCPSLAKP